MRQEKLKSLVFYDPLTGAFRWRKAMANNRIKPWSVAGSTRFEKEHGLEYTKIRISGKTYLAHRLAIVYMLGDEVITGLIVDHKDGVGTNNAWANLRISTTKLNAENRRKSRTNSSGFTGVCWNKTHNHWVSRIKHHGKQIYLGSFKTAQDAASAYESKRKELFEYDNGRHLYG
jgi:hypothetical protein